jgi:MFS family permease
MKWRTVMLCVPIIAITAQLSVAQLVIPPFLDGLNFSISLIGLLISLGPVLALAARLPAGAVYRGERALKLLLGALVVETVGTALYGYATTPLSFATIHGATGFAHGAVTTVYMAFFVEALPPDEDRHHAMGYYTGSMAIGYAMGGLVGGYVADRFGYLPTFWFGASLGLLCLALLVFLRGPTAREGQRDRVESARTAAAAQFAASLLDPKMANVIIVALFLNLLHQMGSTYLPLYGLAIGLRLTEVGLIKGLYALCNAVTRPLSGIVAKRWGRKKLALVSLPLQSFFLVLVPFFHDFYSLLALFLLAGFMRAVGYVVNTISMVEDVDASKVGRGVASGVFNAAADVGNILGPGIGGLIAAFTGVAYLFVAGPLGIAVLFLAAHGGCRRLEGRAQI